MDCNNTIDITTIGSAGGTVEQALIAITPSGLKQIPIPALVLTPSTPFSPDGLVEYSSLQNQVTVLQSAVHLLSGAPVVGDMAPEW